MSEKIFKKQNKIQQQHFLSKLKLKTSKSTLKVARYRDIDIDIDIFSFSLVHGREQINAEWRNNSERKKEAIKVTVLEFLMQDKNNV